MFKFILSTVASAVVLGAVQRCIQKHEVPMKKTLLRLVNAAKLLT